MAYSKKPLRKWLKLENWILTLKIFVLLRLLDVVQIENAFILFYNYKGTAADDYRSELTENIIRPQFMTYNILV